MPDNFPEFHKATKENFLKMKPETSLVKPDDGVVNSGVDQVKQLCVRISNLDFLIDQMTGNPDYKGLVSNDSIQDLVIFFQNGLTVLVEKTALFIWLKLINSIVLRNLYAQFETSATGVPNSFASLAPNVLRVFELISTLISPEHELVVKQQIMFLTLNGSLD